MIFVLKVERKGNKVKVTFSNSTVITISKETFHKFPLKLNKPVDPQTIQRIEKEDEFNLALKKALNFLKVRNHFTEEIRKKLRIRKVDDEIIDKVLDFLFKEKLLDDKKAIQQYVNEMISKNFGPVKIKNELQKRGIQKDLINSLMNSMDESIFRTSAKKTLEKYLNKKVLTKNDLPKIYRYLLSKGFNYEIINKLFEDINVLGDN